MYTPNFLAYSIYACFPNNSSATSNDILKVKKPSDTQALDVYQLSTNYEEKRVNKIDILKKVRAEVNDDESKGIWNSQNVTLQIFLGH